MIPIFNNTEETIDMVMARASFITDKKMQSQVEEIIAEVKVRKDEALFEYTQQFDGVTSKSLRITEAEITNAFNTCDPKLLASLKKAAANIRRFHQKQKTNNYMDYEQDEVILGQLVQPIENIGLYIPGGSAAYPSTVLMNVIPAQIAGCKRIVIVSPPNSLGSVHPSILAAAKLCGVDEIYAIGGAQAIAALTYGTETIKKVDKICGPGNAYVALAKKMVSGVVGVDMIAGPSEILIVADKDANPIFVAADLLAQAEHDPNASAMLLSPSLAFAEAVNLQIEMQLQKRQRANIIETALTKHSYIIIVETVQQACEISNRIAPEHLELMVERPFDILSLIKNAGSIFLGAYAPEVLGDYFAGPNHTLPTNGTARFSSALSVDDFIKKSSIIYYSRAALASVEKDITTIAQAEGLDAHANAIAVRFKS